MYKVNFKGKSELWNEKEIFIQLSRIKKTEEARAIQVCLEMLGVYKYELKKTQRKVVRYYEIIIYGKENVRGEEREQIAFLGIENDESRLLVSTDDMIKV